MDIPAGKIWLSDGRSSKVFFKREILGWRVEYNTSQGLPTQIIGGTVIQGTTMPTGNRIAIRTTDLARPEWIVPFKVKGLLGSYARAHADARDWGSRLDAFLRS